MVSIQLPNAIFLEEVRRQLKAGHTTTFRVRGWSMRPFLENARDKVLLVSPDVRPIKVGDVALVLSTDKRYVLHRVIAVDDKGGCTLWGDGNLFGREYCTSENVIGIAKGFFIGNKERYFDVDGKVWRCYSWCWMHTTSFRRFFLFVYRVFYKLFGTKRN